jgi:cytosine/adenosine deaminase-related metal-dependent hydrolase
MQLNNLHFPGKKGAIDLQILDGKITSILPSLPEKITADNVLPSDLSLSFNNALVFPGLINSHDHLDFNLFPSLGNRIYSNYTEWGPDIQARNKDEIAAILKIPQPLRTRWGLYKNLLNGFTTVVNHGERLETDDNLITVFQDYHCLHSVGFEKRWKWKLNSPWKTRHPFVLHVGEGTDTAAGLEIDRLLRWNLFKRPLVGVHGVAMNEKQASSFRALVWCPASNYFLLDGTASVDRLKNKVPLLFGTDSTLTASWNSWDQIRMAREENKVTDVELLDMLTTTPAAIWGLAGCGELTTGSRADLVIARPREGLKGMDAFYSLNPEDLLLILHKGNIRLFDASLLEPPSVGGLPAKTICGLPVSSFYKTSIGNSFKYIQGDLPGLIQEILRFYPELVFPATAE